MLNELNPNVVTRVDDVVIKLGLEKAQLDRHRLALKILLGDRLNHVNLNTGDNLQVEWRLILEYLGKTEMQLEAVLSILEDKEVVAEAKCDTLEQGKILVFEVFKKLSKVIKRLRKAQAKASMVGHAVDIFIGGEKVATGNITDFT